MISRIRRAYLMARHAWGFPRAERCRRALAILTGREAELRPAHARISSRLAMLHGLVLSGVRYSVRREVRS